MLFLQELLKFQTAFGKIWLAGVKGVKGVKGGLKKPFNKELIKNADIQDLVHAIFSIEVPLSPRLNGVFLAGVCNIYEQKTYYFELDVMALFRKIHFTKRLRSTEDDESPAKKRKRRLKKRPENQPELLVDEMPDLDAILNDMELDLTQMNLDDLQQREQKETEGLEDLVRSQLYRTIDDGELLLEKRCENRTGSLQPFVTQPLETRDSMLFDENHSYVMMDEDELFNEMHHHDDEALEDRGRREDSQQMEDGPKHHLEEIQSPLENTTPPPLNYKDIEEHGIQTQHPHALMTETPKAQKARSRPRREAQCSAVSIDKETFLPEVMLREWRLDRSTITTKRMALRQLCDIELNHVYSTQIGSTRLRRLMEYLESRFVDHPASMPKKNVSPKRSSPMLDVLDMNPVEMIEDEDLGFQQIERLRGVWEDNPMEQDHEEVHVDALVGGKRRESGGGFSEHSIDETSGTHTRRSSFADPFYERSSLGGRSSTAYESYDEMEMGAAPRIISSSRRDSISSRIQERIIADWFDPNELVSAVSPLAIVATQDTTGELLVGANMLRPSAELEIEYSSMNTNERRSQQVQKNYTMESWRFRTFIENCLEREKHRLEDRNAKMDTDSSLTVPRPVLPFSAMVIPGTVSPLIAARAFYQLLVLISCGEVEVDQQGMDGEILIAKGELVLSSNQSVGGYGESSSIPYSDQPSSASKILCS